VSKVLPMWNKCRSYAIAVVGVLGLALMMVGTGCEETPEKGRPPAPPEKEAVQKKDLTPEQKPPESAGPGREKPQANPEKGKASPGQPARRSALTNRSAWEKSQAIRSWGRSR